MKLTPQELADRLSYTSKPKIRKFEFGGSIENDPLNLRQFNQTSESTYVQPAVNKLERDLEVSSIEREKIRQSTISSKPSVVDKIKTHANPKNWGVTDYTDKGDFNTAYGSARQAGEKEFMWNNQRFNTKKEGDINNDNSNIFSTLLKPLLKVHPNEHDYGERNGIDLITETIKALKENVGGNIEKDLQKYLDNTGFTIEDLKKGKVPFTEKMQKDLEKEFHTKEREIGDNYLKLGDGNLSNLEYYTIRTNGIQGNPIQLNVSTPFVKSKEAEALYNHWKNYPKLRNESKTMSKSEEYAFNNHVTRDIWRKYLGQPQLYNSIIKSKYKPSVSKNSNSSYYTFSNLREWKEELLTNNVIDNLKIGEKRLSQNYIGELGDLGTYSLQKGYDKNREAEYISLYDRWDLITGSNKDEEGNSIFKIPEVGKPVELYDRFYYKDYGNGIRKEMYYSDKELSELDANKKNFNTFSLQRELSNRGYKFPKSVKKDGTFDGILGEETRQALLDYQTILKTKFK